MEYYYFVSFSANGGRVGNSQICMTKKVEKFGDIQYMEVVLSKMHPKAHSIVLMDYKLLRTEDDSPE